MDQAELTLLVNMRYEELGIQQGSCATQKAQLNQQEKVLLAERDKAVKALQENPFFKPTRERKLVPTGPLDFLKS